MTNIEQVREQIDNEIALELFDIWKEAKSTTGEPWDEVLYENLPESHKEEYGKTARRILSLIQPLIDQAVNHEANEWIAGISAALGRGYFVYDPKIWQDRKYRAGIG